MLKRLVLIAMLALAAARADALEYTDVYYNPAESGWGVFLVQSETTQFLALFIYGQDGKPTWYVGQLTQDIAGNYNGTLFSTTGTYYILPWAGYSGGPVGTVSFQPIDNYHATLTYTVNGVGTVTKAVQRQTLTPYVLTGNYSGSMSGSVTGCTNPASNDTSLRARYNLAVTQVADQSATLTFTYVDTSHAGIVCTASGPLTHLGRLYQISNAQFSCTGPGISPVPSTATLNSFHPTGQGIEGRVTGDGGGGCVLSLHFAAVLNVNN
jgi:hypothetical protein